MHWPSLSRVYRHFKPWPGLRLNFGVNTALDLETPDLGQEIWAHINRWPRPGHGPDCYGNMGRSSDIQRQTREKRVQKN